MGKFFIFLNDFLLHRKLVLVVLVICLIGLVSYSIFHLKTNEDFSSIFPENESIEQYNFAIKNSSFTDRIIIYLSSNDSTSSNKTDSLIKYADLFVESLNAELRNK